MPASDWLRAPDFPGAPGWWPRIEGAIDAALSSSTGWLDFLLAPVRGFVHDVLHPVVSFADVVVGAAWGWVRWGWDRLVDLWGDAGRALDWVEMEAGQLASWAYNAAVGFARAVADDVQRYAAWAWADARQLASDLWSDARAFTAWAWADARNLATVLWRDARAFTDWAWRDARSLADVLWRDARHFATQLTDWAVATARRLVDDLRQWATNAVLEAEALASDRVRALERTVRDLLDALRRDVIEPLRHGLDALWRDWTHFLDAEWSWVKDAEDWIRWATTRAVPEVVGAWRAARDFDPADVFDNAGALAGRALGDVWALAGGMAP